MKRKSLKELTDNGVPYFVSPDDLRALQIGPGPILQDWIQRAAQQLGRLDARPQGRRGADRASAVNAFASRNNAVSASAA